MLCVHIGRPEIHEAQEPDSLLFLVERPRTFAVPGLAHSGHPDDFYLLFTADGHVVLTHTAHAPGPQAPAAPAPPPSSGAP